MVSMPPGDVFSALANPVRRRLMEALQDGPCAAGELASQFALSRPAISEHLTVLKNAQLVREEPRGRHRYYHVPDAVITCGAGTRWWTVGQDRPTHAEPSLHSPPPGR